MGWVSGGIWLFGLLCRNFICCVIVWNVNGISEFYFYCECFWCVGLYVRCCFKYESVLVGKYGDYWV